MSKMSTDLVRHVLSGATMGTRWSAQFFARHDVAAQVVERALQAAVAEVDAQMSTWNAGSDLMRLNAAPIGLWCPVPERMFAVLELGLAIGAASGGAFDIGMGDAVTAWGFGAEAASAAAIRVAMAGPVRAAGALELDAGRVRKSAAVTLDLNGIAKGYGTDRLAEVLMDFGVRDALVGIDGEMRALGAKPDGTAWSVAVEAPEIARRAAHSVLVLQDAAVATSGDYRHWVEVAGQRLSHTMDPVRGAPLQRPPASVSVIARSCAEADAWASALMVLGPHAGAEVVRRHGLSALFLLREASPEATGGVSALGIGALFEAQVAADETI